MEERLPRRLISMLLGYPLIATAVAIDSVCTLLDRGWWPAAAYTLAIATIAGAIAAYSEHMIDLPAAIHVLAVGAALIMSNAAMITATGEISRIGRYPGGDAAVALLFSFTSLTVTTLICHLGETLAEHLHSRDLPASNLDHSWSSTYNAATPPTADLSQPTLTELDHSWETILHQLTGLSAEGQNTMEAADLVQASQPQPMLLAAAPTWSDVHADLCGEGRCPSDAPI